MLQTHSLKMAPLLPHLIKPIYPCFCSSWHPEGHEIHKPGQAQLMTQAKQATKQVQQEQPWKQIIVLFAWVFQKLKRQLYCNPHDP